MSSFDIYSERQTFGSVFSAELKGLFSRKGFVISVCVLALVAVCLELVGIACAKFVASVQGGSSASTVTSYAGDAAGTFLYLMSFYCLIFACKSYATGEMRTKLLLVPNRARLYLAQAFCWALIAAVVSLICGIVAAPVTLAFGATGGLDVAALGMALVLRFVCGFLTVVAAYGFAAVLRSTAGSIILFFCAMTAAGMALASGTLAGGFIADLCNTLNQAMLGSGIDAANAITTDVAAGSIGLVVVIAWAVVFTLLGMLRFKHYNK